jgi:hypothetical protein
LNNSKNQPKSSAIESLLELCASSVNQEQITLQINNWKSVIDLAEQHRIAKVVDQVIKAQEMSIPSELNERLTTLTKRGTLRMLAFSAEISSICHPLNQEGIKAIPLKGPIAAKQIYNDFTAKFSRDIDFLIQQEQLDHTIQIIEQQGYVITYPYQSLSAKQKKAFQKVNNQLAFFHVQKKIQLEIHWRLFVNPYLLPITFDKLIAEGSQIQIGKTTVPCLSNKHLLFFLCAHGAKHQWALLYWLVEVATLIKKENFDWDIILQEAIRFNIERPLVQGIMLIEIHFKMPAPICIRKHYQKDKTIQEIVQISSMIVNENEQNISKNPILNYWQNLSYKMKLKKELNYKLAYWKGFSVNDFQLIKLPDALFFCYFWFRPIFWVWRYIVRPIKK